MNILTLLGLSPVPEGGGQGQSSARGALQAPRGEGWWGVYLSQPQRDEEQDTGRGSGGGGQACSHNAGSAPRQLRGSVPVCEVWIRGLLSLRTCEE